MFDLDKIFQIADSGKEVFIARDAKPMLVVMPLEQYDRLTSLEKKDVLENRIKDTGLNEDYASRVRRSIIE